MFLKGLEEFLIRRKRSLLAESKPKQCLNRIK